MNLFTSNNKQKKINKIFVFTSGILFLVFALGNIIISLLFPVFFSFEDNSEIFILSITIFGLSGLMSPILLAILFFLNLIIFKNKDERKIKSSKIKIIVEMMVSFLILFIGVFLVVFGVFSWIFSLFLYGGIVFIVIGLSLLIDSFRNIK